MSKSKFFDRSKRSSDYMNNNLRQNSLDIRRRKSLKLYDPALKLFLMLYDFKNPTISSFYISFPPITQKIETPRIEHDTICDVFAKSFQLPHSNHINQSRYEQYDQKNSQSLQKIFDPYSFHCFTHYIRSNELDTLNQQNFDLSSKIFPTNASLSYKRVDSILDDTSIQSENNFLNSPQNFLSSYLLTNSTFVINDNLESKFRSQVESDCLDIKVSKPNHFNTENEHISEFLSTQITEIGNIHDNHNNINEEFNTDKIEIKDFYDPNIFRTFSDDEIQQNTTKLKTSGHSARILLNTIIHDFFGIHNCEKEITFEDLRELKSNHEILSFVVENESVLNFFVNEREENNNFKYKKSFVNKLNSMEENFVELVVDYLHEELEIYFIAKSVKNSKFRWMDLIEHIIKLIDSNFHDDIYNGIDQYGYEVDMDSALQSSVISDKEVNRILKHKWSW